MLRTPTGKYYDIQVKSFRPGTGYAYLYRLDPSLLLALVQFIDGESPGLFLVHSCLPEGPNPIFKKCSYTVNGKREFEWGLPLSKRNLVVLSRDYNFQAVASRLTVLPLIDPGTQI